jgi:hypothetical protein
MIYILGILIPRFGVVMLRFDRRLWTGPKPSSFIVYALDIGHLALAPNPVPEYEKTALFKEKAKANVQNGYFAVDVPAKVYEFYYFGRIRRSGQYF